MDISNFFKSIFHSNENKAVDTEALFNADNSIISPQPIDLGLPSGILWADRNVGARTPEDRGIVVKWGGVSGWRDGHLLSPNDGHFHSIDASMSKTIFTKYRTQPVHISADNRNILDPEDDAAHVFLGEKWTTPTKEEIQELIDNTDIEHINVIGCFRYTSRINGNTILLPTVMPGNFHGAVRSEQCWYWSSSLCPLGENSESYCLEQSDIYEVSCEVSVLFRDCELPIRPIIRNTNHFKQ